jgi:alpha-1,3-glucan synthase
MPGWWYTIESTTTKHLIDQFEHACREALSSDRPTREMMRAKSARQRFPVIEWIRKLDRLQIMAIKVSERANKRPATNSKGGLGNSLQKLDAKSSHGNVNRGIDASFNTHTRGLPLVEPPTSLHDSPSSSPRGSFPDSAASEQNEDLTNPTNYGTTAHELPRIVPDTSLKDMLDDGSSIEPPESLKGVIRPPPKGSSLSRKLSLGTRLGPGHVRIRKHDSKATIESLGPIEEEQRFTMPDDDGDDEYFYSAASIRRRMAANQGSRAGYADSTDSSDAESDAFNTADSDSVSEYDPRAGQLRQKDSLYFDDDQDNSNNLFASNPKDPERLGLGPYVPQADIESSRRPSLEDSTQKPSYAGGLSPHIIPPFQRTEAGNLSLASVLGAREEFALSKVDDMFTDADGKYFKQFSADLYKLDSKTSKDDLCIEEFLIKSEKEWSNDVRNRKLGLDSHLVSDTKAALSNRDSEAPIQHTEDNPVALSPPESRIDEPFVGYRRLTGLKLLFQRRIGDWPIYSFPIALVSQLYMAIDFQGQVIAASSYQLTLLTDQTIQSATQLYVLASIYFVTSILWWIVFRKFQAIYCLSIPFYIYALAFFFIGLPSFSPFRPARTWINNIGTGFYAAASSSGSLFFALNFADEGLLQAHSN